MRSFQKHRRLVAFGAGMLVAAAIACSSSSSKPPELGGCTPTDEAGCQVSSSGGGGGGPHKGDGGGDGAITDTGGSTGCGTAQQWIQTSNLQCAQCVEGASPTGCCESDLACSSVSDCIVLLQCTEACANDTTCISSCQAKYPNGMSAYLGFAQCVNNDCTPMCPTLPLAQPGDF